MFHRYREALARQHIAHPGLATPQPDAQRLLIRRRRQTHDVQVERRTAGRIPNHNPTPIRGKGHPRELVGAN
jgi:hypothetical protein